MLPRKIKGNPIASIPRTINVELTHLQDTVLKFIDDNPNCKLTDIYEGIPNTGERVIRNIVGKLQRKHRVVQGFSVVP